MRKLLLIAALMVLATVASAQMTGGPPGVPASVTSITPRNPAPGVPPSVTSFSALHPPPSTGFTAFNPPPLYGVLGANQNMNGFNGAFRGGFNGGFGHQRHHRRDNFAAAPYGYAYPVYVPVEPEYEPDASYDVPSGNAMDRELWSRAAEREDRSIDRRDDYAASREDAREQYRDAEEQSQKEAAQQLPAADETQLVLITKDGTRVELGNYAIVGSTFYDLVHHGKKYLVADLDLAKTQKANEDMGFEFRLPASAQR
jgi:hypothetical protein